MESVRRLGYRPDPQGTVYPQHLRALRDPKVSLPNSDLTAFRSGRVFQGQIGMCVLSALKRAVQMYSAIHYGNPFMMSDVASYGIVRATETITEDPSLTPEDIDLSVVGDIGAYPAMALAACNEVGLIPEESWPGPASGRTDWDAMVSNPPNSDAILTAFDARGLQFLSVDWTWNGLRNTVRELYRAGHPVILAINADGIADSDPGNGIVTSLSRTGLNHCVTIVSAEDVDCAIVDNWWDDYRGAFGAWGIQSDDLLRGCWRVTWPALERGCSDVLAITGVPDARKAG